MNLSQKRIESYQRPIRICIEGNIAAGKSTFLNVLGKELDFVVVPEPVERWQNVTDCKGKNGGNVLDIYYKDPKRWGFTFQTFALQSLAEAASAVQTLPHRTSGLSLKFPSAKGISVVEAEEEEELDDDRATGPSPKRARRNPVSNDPPVYFFERSIYSYRYCFAKNCYEQGSFNDTEYNIYCDCHEFMAQQIDGLKPDGFIYLQASPETCHQRLKIRSRGEEAGVSLSYLSSIHAKHESWLEKKELTDTIAKQIRDVPVLTLDVNKDFEHDMVQRTALVRKVREWIKARQQAKEEVGSPMEEERRGGEIKSDEEGEEVSGAAATSMMMMKTVTSKLQQLQQQQSDESSQDEDATTTTSSAAATSSSSTSDEVDSEIVEPSLMCPLLGDSS